MNLFLRMCPHRSAPTTHVRISCRRVTRLWILSTALLIFMFYTFFTLFSCVYKRGVMNEKLKYLKIKEAIGSGLAAKQVLPNVSTVLVQPYSKHCQKNNGEKIYTLFMIISSPKNSAARTQIRNGLKYFMNDYNDIRKVPGDSRANELFFFVGIASDEKTKAELQLEAELNGDIIIDNMHECYLCLTLKTLRMLKWVRAHCPKAKFVAKVDDDIHLNLQKLFTILAPLSETPNGANLIGGSLFIETPPVRDPDSKWFVPAEIYKTEAFPNYVGGTFYVLGYDAARRIYEQSLKTQMFHLEDVFVTGLIPQEIHLTPTMLSGILGDWRPMDHLRASSCTIRDTLLSVHFRYPVWNYIQCWREFNRRNFVCSDWPLILSIGC